MLAGDKIGFAGVSFAFGLSLLAMVYAIGPISGCHINPAVTVGLLLSKKVNPKYAPGYLVAQVVGALVAAGLLLVIAKRGPSPYDPAVTGFAANGYGEHSPGRYNLTAAFMVEVILTAFLVLTVLGGHRARSASGLCRDSHWLGLSPDSFGGDSCDEYLGEPRQEHWPGSRPSPAGLVPGMKLKPTHLKPTGPSRSMTFNVFVPRQTSG